MKKIVASLVSLVMLLSGGGMCLACTPSSAPGIEDSQSPLQLSAQEVEVEVIESTQPNAKETETLEILETQKPLKASGMSRAEIKKMERLGDAGAWTVIGGAVGGLLVTVVGAMVTVANPLVGGIICGVGAVTSVLGEVAGGGCLIAYLIQKIPYVRQMFN